MPDAVEQHPDPGFDFASGRSMVVLVPRPSAAYCYLYEALLWVALQRLPLAEPWEDNVDTRTITEDLDSASPRLESEPITDDECQKVGLPPNPEYALHCGDEYHPEPRYIEELLRLVPGDEHREKLLADLDASKVHHQALDGWRALFDEFVDLHKSRLFLALREGKILSVGKPFPLAMASDFPERLSPEEWDAWVEAPWRVIKPDSWLSTGIDWADCRAVGRHAAHALILVSTLELITAFPPTDEPVQQAVRFGDCYAIPEDAAGPRVDGVRRGRPSLDWDAFHLEMARRLQAGDLPAKQEALIADMQAWCLRSWGRDVGRSTLLQKVKPYYSAFVRLSEKAAD
jgi:hypothetical protein